MKVLPFWTLTTLFLGLIMLVGCSPLSKTEIAASLEEKLLDDASSTNGIPAIMATTPIIAEWVNQVGGNRILAASIIPYSVDPHSYQPGAKDIAAIIQAEYLFAVGLLYEATWLNKLLINHPETQLVELGQFSNPIEFRARYEDEHHDEDEHRHGRYDPHFWFDPLRVSSVIGKIATVLSEIDPDGKTYYSQRAEAYKQELQRLDAHISSQIETIPEERRKIMSGHESLGYLEERYDILILQAIIPSLSSDTGSTPQDLVEAINLVREHNIPAIFVEAETTGKSASRIAQETGVRVANGLNVETLKEGQSYIDFMEHNIQVIVSNLVE